jgi:hypothetical protein
MQLDLADFPVREIRLGKSYRYQSGTLALDREDLARLVLQDERIEEARFVNRRALPAFATSSSRAQNLPAAVKSFRERSDRSRVLAAV